MTDETKKLFDAPWVVMGDAEDYKKFNVIIHSPQSQRHCCTVASCVDRKTAIRFVRLPEIYDALLDSVRRICSTCIGSNLSDMPLDDIGMYCRANCKVHKYTALLKNVRDGK